MAHMHRPCGKKISRIPYFESACASRVVTSQSMTISFPEHPFSNNNGNNRILHIRFHCAVRSLHLWYIWRMPEMDTPRALHSGQTTEHARDLSTSGPAMWCSNQLEHSACGTNCIGLWIIICWASFCAWMNHYLNALTCINKDFYGTKRKRGDPI